MSEPEITKRVRFNLDANTNYEVSDSQHYENENGEERDKPWLKQDTKCWLLGMLFITLLCVVITYLGNARGWYAPSGFIHNISVTSQERFLPEPEVDEPGVHGRTGQGRVSRWYYWKLPPDRVTVYTRLFVWVCYFSHQIFIWGVIYMAQANKMPRYSHKLNIYNWLAFGGNIFFHLLHLLQTHVTYDALAQDVAITSSQGSAIMLLAYCSLIDYRDRGILFGWPSRRKHRAISSQQPKLSDEPMYIVRKYHSYAFAWAAIYTFWYHPMENTLGHILGFLHTWMILLQGSLMYTKFHLHKWWRFVLEAWVTLHGGVVAFQVGGSVVIWPMFLTGFLMMIGLTQIFTFNFWKKIRTRWRFVPLTLALLVAYGIYSIPDDKGRTIERMYQMMFIPMASFFTTIFSYAFFCVCLKLEKMLAKLFKPANHSRLYRTCKQAFCGHAAFAVLFGFVSAGILVEQIDIKLEVFVLMYFLSTLYSLGFVVFAMFMRNHIPLDIP
ncbi:uncharacterized protein LOC141915221 [Tubulanus polymorphus]|uniref:uncharacterized protein LOC141915221 n=1 Tax=Tubulanus polymorphus TaxID=672921 RepID=UPI003DA4A6B6